jgi:hypothetical protein
MKMKRKEEGGEGREEESRRARRGMVNGEEGIYLKAVQL